MTVMDILRLRDSMIKIQLLGKFPPAERGRMELQFNDALAQASQRWAEQHLTTLFGQKRAKEILDRLNRDQIG